MLKPAIKSDCAIRPFQVVDLVATCLMLVLARPGVCQADTSQDEESPPSEQTEEIIVYGDKSMRVLRIELHRAEEQVFELFNTLNSDDEFDIHCNSELPVGSHIPKRTCRPNFVNRLLSDYNISLLSGIPVAPVTGQIRQKERLLQREMEELLPEHPELLEALNRYSAARDILESAKNQE